MTARMPAHVILKDISATYNEQTIPRQLREDPGLHPEIWGEVVVAEGEVDLKVKGTTVRVTPAEAAHIPPAVPFSLQQTGKPVRFSLRYYHDPILQDARVVEEQLAKRGA